MEKSNFKNLAVVAIITFLNSITFSSIIPIIYSYAGSFGLKDTAIGFLFGIFSLAQFLATPIIGRLSDKYGRKPLLIISLLGTFFASLIQAFAFAGWVLFLGRFLDGITGGNNSVAQAVISDSTSKKDKSTGFAIFGASFGVGFIVGPLVALFLADFGNSSVFLFSAAAALFATLLTIFILPETIKTKETKKLDLIDTLFLQIYRGLKMPIVGDILILNLLISITFAIFQVAFQPYIIESLKLGEEYVGYALIMVGLVNIFLIPLVRIFSNKFGLNILLNISIFLRFIFFITLAVVIDVYWFWAMMILFALVNVFSRPVISTLLTNYSKEEDRGVVFGVSESLFSLGLTIGPALFSLTVIPQEEVFITTNSGSNFLLDFIINSSQNYTLPFYLGGFFTLLMFGYSLYATKFKFKENTQKADF
jgi:MFS family permease